MTFVQKFRRLNALTMLAMLALCAIGTMAICSAGNARQEAIFHGAWRSNLVTVAFGFAIYLVLAFTDYRRLLSFAAVPVYAITLVLLVAVLAFGAEVYGGRRWLWFFQPSEIAKLGIVTLLASVIGGGFGPVRAWRQSFRGFVLAGALVGIPALLILLEPDLGTTLTLVPSALLMMLAARVWYRGLVAIVTALALAGVFVLGAVYEAEKPGVTAERRERIMKWVPLRPHQVRRVRVYLFPDEDASGAGYNLRQAKISIGSGGLRGKGFGKGENNHLKYLPPSISMNDFIFCVWAEETGYVGSLTLLALYAVLLVSSVWTAIRTCEDCGRLLVLGISALIFAHVFINIAMSVGLVPITGLPLPFISSGRTFLVTAMAGLGLVQSVAIHGGKTNVERTDPRW